MIYENGKPLELASGLLLHGEASEVILLCRTKRNGLKLGNKGWIALPPLVATNIAQAIESKTQVKVAAKVGRALEKMHVTSDGDNS